MGSDDRQRPELRRVDDVKTLRALTHPTRVALLETLLLEGPLTATDAAEHVGESPSSCSFHLRQLAKYGFVEEAEGGKGRRRPWKLTTIGMMTSTATEDPAANVAASALQRLFRDRQLARYEEWLRTQRSYPDEWQTAGINDQYVFWLTAAELEALREQLRDVLMPVYRNRLTDPVARPEGAQPVEMLTFAYPMAPPASDASERGDSVPVPGSAPMPSEPDT